MPEMGSSHHILAQLPPRKCCSWAKVFVGNFVGQNNQTAARTSEPLLEGSSWQP